MSATASAGHCAFGYCRGSLAGRGRSLYCCDEHAEAARSRQTVEARAARVTEAAYERISRGEAEPLPHLGWLATTDGVVLDGAVVVELRALVTSHREAMSELVGLVRRPGVNMRQVAGELERRTLAVDRQLLAALRQALTDQQPPRR